MDNSIRAWETLRDRFAAAADKHSPLCHFLMFAPASEQEKLDRRRHTPPLVESLNGHRGPFVRSPEGPWVYPLVGGSDSGIARQDSSATQALLYTGHFYWRVDPERVSDEGSADAALVRWDQLASDATRLLGTDVGPLSVNFGHDPLIEPTHATGFGDERWMLALHALGARGDAPPLRSKRYIATPGGFSGLGDGTATSGVCAFLSSDVFLASVYAIDWIIVTLSQRERMPPGDPEVEALVRLGERAEWAMDELPAWIDADILRCLDDRGWVEARHVVMQNVAKTPDDQAPPVPAPLTWVSPIEHPEHAGNWTVILSKRTRSRWQHPYQVKVTERGRVELARMRREVETVSSPTFPTTKRQNDPRDMASKAGTHAGGVSGAAVTLAHLLDALPGVTDPKDRLAVRGWLASFADSCQRVVPSETWKSATVEGCAVRIDATSRHWALPTPALAVTWAVTAHAAIVEQRDIHGPDGGALCILGLVPGVPGTVEWMDDVEGRRVPGIVSRGNANLEGEDVMCWPLEVLIGRAVKCGRVILNEYAPEMARATPAIPNDTVRHLVQAIEGIKLAGTRDDDKRPAAKLPKLKTWAWKAWQANQAGMTVSAIADTLAREYGDSKITQPRVTEQIQRTKLHAEASGLATVAATALPRIESRAPARTSDPAAADQGKRTDGKAHHIREKSRQKAKDGDDDDKE